MQACTSGQTGVSVAKHVPCEADSRLGKKQRMVAGESVGETGGGRGADDSVGKGVDAGAVLRFAPAGRGLRAEADPSLERWRDVPGVFEERIGEQRAPAELGGDRSVGEGLDCAGEEGGQRREGSLAVLVLGEIIVGLQALQPDSGLDGVLADGVIRMIVEGVEIPRDAVVRSDIRPGGGDGRRASDGG